MVASGKRGKCDCAKVASPKSFNLRREKTAGCVMGRRVDCPPKPLSVATGGGVGKGLPAYCALLLSVDRNPTEGLLVVAEENEHRAAGILTRFVQVPRRVPSLLGSRWQRV